MDNKVTDGLQMIVTELAQQADSHQIQSRIFASQGLTKLAKQYEEHAAEERGYVVKCIDRLIDLDCEVKLEAKSAAPVIWDAVDFLKHDLQISKHGLAWLKDVLCAAQDDPTTFDLLKAYYQDEEADMYQTEQQLALVDMIGKQNWFVQQL